MHLRALLVATFLSCSGAGLAQDTAATELPTVASSDALTAPQIESLTELARMSDVVVVVVPAARPTLELPVDITPWGQRPDAKKWPAWIQVRERFIVQEVISNRPRNGARPKALKVGAIIEVDSASHSEELMLHRERYLEGINASMIARHYTVVGTTASKARILFLQKHPGGLQHAMTGGTEHVEHRALVDAAVLATAPAPR